MGEGRASDEDGHGPMIGHLERREAIAETCMELVWLKDLYAEVCGDNSCIDLLCDSQSSIYFTKD